jgi:hypothetical protein
MISKGTNSGNELMKGSVSVPKRDMLLPFLCQNGADKKGDDVCLASTISNSLEGSCN